MDINDPIFTEMATELEKKNPSPTPPISGTPVVETPIVKNDELPIETPEAKLANEKEAQELAAKAKAKEDAEKEVVAAKEREELAKYDLDDKGNPKTDEHGAKVLKNSAPAEKEWFESDEVVANVNKTNEKESGKTQEKLSKLAEYEKILADPEIEAFVEFKKTGKGIKDFYNEVVGTDYDSLSPDALQEIKLKNLGMQGEDLAEALEAFSALPKWDKVERTSGLKDQLKAKQAESLKRFSVDAKAMQAKQEELNRKTIQEADNYAKQLVGQKKFGIEITPDHAHEVRQAVVEGVKEFFKEDGSLNLETFGDAIIAYRNIKTIVSKNVERAMNKGKGEVLAEVTRPSKNETVNRVPDEKNGSRSEYDKASDAFFSQYAPK